MLDHCSSYELSEWMALVTVEAEEDEQRREDPEGWKAQHEATTREPPGVLVRIAETEAADEDKDDPIDGEAKL